MFEHSSGLPKAYDRAAADLVRARLVFPEGNYLQGADLNELQSIEARIRTRVGNMTAADGDRISGCSIVVNSDAGTIGLDAGTIYIRGDVRPVVARSIASVPMTGDVQIGVRLVRTLVTAVDDPTLLGLEPGTWAEGEPGAAREREAISWSLGTSSEPGDFFAVYLLRDGAVLDQSPPPSLSGIKPMLAEYDRDAHGNYIVSGCQVSALGKVGTDQIFSVAPGVANIYGYKISRQYALRHAQTEDPDLETISAEPHTYLAATGAPSTVGVNHSPIAAVSSAIVVKRITETVVRGSVTGGTDALSKASVVAIESVVQGGTTFAGTTYTQAGDAVSWLPSGSEPAAGSTYQVTYLYNAAVTPDAVTATTVTVSGGVNGQPILLTYTSKLPRIDLLCLNPAGATSYVKGLSARKGAVAPILPNNLLHLCTITNDWLTTPAIVNDGTYSITFDTMARYFQRLIDVISEFNRADAERDILTRQPVAKRGIFTDAFADDSFRDQGVAQTLAILDGTAGLAVDTVGVAYLGTTPVCLAFVDEVVVSQTLATSSMPINPYAITNRLPAGMTVEPAVDFWTDHTTEWTSPETQEFTDLTDTVPAGTVTGTSTITSVVSDRIVAAQYLRQISVTIHIDGFGVGEHLSALTFGGIDVLPSSPPSGGSDGKIAVTITIPAGIPAGTVLVHANGAAGSFAQCLYVGDGTIEVETLRQVTLVQRAVRASITNITTVTETTNVTNVTNVTTVTASPTVDFFANDNGGGMDPLAETFRLSEARHISAIRVKLAAIGDRSKGIRIQIRKTLNGYPTSDILAEAFVSMASPAVGDWITGRFAVPVYVDEASTYAFVILTDDTVHALAISRQGDVLTAGDGSQSFVSAAPYTVGVMFSSSNAQTWTAHNDADLVFEIVAAKFTATEQVFALGTVAMTAISDILVRGTIEVPTAGCSFRYELVRADGSVIKAAAGQTINLSAFITETVTVRAVLSGTTKTSPILYPGSTVITGRMRTSGTYVSRAFSMGTAIAVYAVFAAYVPAGAAVVVEVDDTTGAWTALTAGSAAVLGNGWTEPSYSKNPHTAASGGRVRITLTGGPDTRPQIARLRAFSI